MSKLQVDNIVNKGDNGAPTLSKGAIITGIVTATGGSFSGNVSVGGTLTYEDVTNIDSVGVVTARTGIKVLAGGINAVGVVTATSFSGDGSALTGVSPTFTGIASGSLSNGQAVIITSDGKVTGITRTETPVPQAGSTGVFEDGSVSGGFLRGVFDPDSGRVVVVYSDTGGNNAGRAAAGLVSSDGTIAFGSPATWHSGGTDEVGIAYDTANDRIIVCGKDTGASDPIYNVGSLSGNSITFGSYAALNNSGVEVKVSYDTNADRVLFTFLSGGVGRCRAGEVSGLTVINLGTEVTYSSGDIQTTTNSVRYHEAAQKHVITYAMATGYNGRARVATIDPSDNSVSFGTEATFHSSSNVTETTAIYDPDNQRMAISFKADSKVNAIVAQVTGTNLTFGPKNVIFDADGHTLDNTYDTTNNKVIFSFRNAASPYDGKFCVGNIDTSDNSISIASTTSTTGSSSGYNQGVTYSPTTDHIVFFYPDSNSSNRGTALTYKSISANTNMTTGNFLGFSNAAYTNGQSATIQVVGSIDDAQTGLTTGAKHYVQKNGSLATSADSPSIEAGIALSDTKILIR